MHAPTEIARTLRDSSYVLRPISRMKIAVGGHGEQGLPARIRAQTQAASLQTIAIETERCDIAYLGAEPSLGEAEARALGHDESAGVRVAADQPNSLRIGSPVTHALFLFGLG
jgi:hypothetical protein